MKTAIFALALGVVTAAAAESTPTNAPLPKTDANGNALRRAPTGHVSNYDEEKAGVYTLPELLTLQNGKPVKDAAGWFEKRRPELIELYRREIYGRVPSRAPKARFEVVETTNVFDGAGIRKHVVARFGDGPDGPQVDLMLYLPAKAEGPVPALLHMTFFGDAAVAKPLSTNYTPGRPRFTEMGPVADILARGYAYGIYRYTEVEPDSTNFLKGVIGLGMGPGQSRPGADEWGSISAWAWGASRMLDYLGTDAAVDAKRVALIGHSRLGKTALWAGAQDARFSLILSSCSGEMGASLSRRDYGETVDDMAANFPWQFAGNFQRYAGHWNEMPVDAHMVIALNAPHGVFITGGTKDQWADPKGEFLAEVAAGAVYRLTGKKDLGATEFPAPDAPVMGGELAFNYHTGAHTTTAEEWKLFLDFANRHWKAAK